MFWARSGTKQHRRTCCVTAQFFAVCILVKVMAKPGNAAKVPQSNEWSSLHLKLICNTKSFALHIFFPMRNDSSCYFAKSCIVHRVIIIISESPVFFSFFFTLNVFIINLSFISIENCLSLQRTSGFPLCSLLFSLWGEHGFKIQTLSISCQSEAVAMLFFYLLSV